MAEVTKQLENQAIEEKEEEGEKGSINASQQLPGSALLNSVNISRASGVTVAPILSQMEMMGKTLQGKRRKRKRRRKDVRTFCWF